MVPSFSTMADDKKTTCSYCDSQHTQLDYALHRVSNNHVKKVQRNLLHRGFTSACLVCNRALKDLKQAELHVHEKTHTDRMTSFLVGSYLCNDKCTCGSCGITFYNEVALEAHRLSPLHMSTASPKLDELSRLLSGLYGKQFMSFCNDLCWICDIKFHDIENSIMHLFTAAHISRLRSSSCMVCKKQFTHASDRELHLKSPKHQIALRKCRNLLEEGRSHALLRKGGYPCMLCMLWCDSWFCLELHLLDIHHAKASLQSKAKCPISARVAFSAGLEGIGQDMGCDESTMSCWREWRSDALEECVWCHRCGVSLLNLDELNKHLNKHSIDGPLTISRSHSSNIFESASVSDSSSCSVCAVSFKNTFMLSVHEASFEHLSRLAACCFTDDVQCCSNCGLLMNNEGDGNGAAGGSLPQTKRVVVSSKCLELLNHQSSSFNRSKNTSNVRVLDTIMQATGAAEGTRQTSLVADKVFTEAHSFLLPDKRDTLLKVSMALRSEELPVSISSRTARDGEDVNRVSIQNGSQLNESFCTVYTCHDDHVSSQLGGSGNPKNCYTSTDIVTDRNGIVARKSGTTMCSCLAANENGTNHSPHKVLPPNVAANSPLLDGHLQLTCPSLDDNVVWQNPVLLAGQVSNGNGSELTKKASVADTVVPIVVAATFTPLGNLQESLQSITAIVTESLSSALPTFCMQQSTSVLKRKSESFVDEETARQQDVKRMCPERILEAALRRGLQSVCPNATMPKDLDVECHCLADKENVMLRIWNDEDVTVPQAVVAVAASVIPNSLRDSSRPAGVHVQLEGNRAQGSSAMHSGDDSNRRAQESTEVKSESLSQVVVGDQGSSGSTRGKTVIEKKLTQLESSHLHPTAGLLCTGTQNAITSTPVSLANGATSPLKNEVFFPAKKLIASIGVVESDVSKESKSNDEYDDDDDDFYTFLDPTKGPKWWSSSDSEDGDMSK